MIETQDIWSSASTDASGWSSFWGNLSDATSTTPRFRWWNMLWLDTFHWDFKFSRDEIVASDLSIHGKISGKLRPPKLQLPKGYGNRVKTQRHEYSGPHYR